MSTMSYDALSAAAREYTELKRLYPIDVKNAKKLCGGQLLMEANGRYGSEVAKMYEDVQGRLLRALAELLSGEDAEVRIRRHYFKMKSKLKCSFDDYLASVHYRAFMGVFLFNPDIVPDFWSYIFSPLGRKMIERDVSHLCGSCCDFSYYDDGSVIVAKVA